VTIQDAPQSLGTARLVRPDHHHKSDVPPSARLSTSVAVIWHGENAPLGRLAEVLDAHELTWNTVHAGNPESFPDPAEVTGAILIGSSEPTGASRPESTGAEIDWLRRAHHAGGAILGVGSGAQTLALALGGGIEVARRPQRGWVHVETADSELLAPGPWLAWHDHAIQIPPRAELLAHTAVGPLAFRAGRHLGVQLHAEVTPEIIGGWVLTHASGGIDAQGLLETASREQSTAAATADRLFSGFVASVRFSENRAA
jgi:GMP synthase-like glutamine amidotransferase